MTACQLLPSSVHHHRACRLRCIATRDSSSCKVLTWHVNADGFKRDAQNGATTPNGDCTAPAAGNKAPQQGAERYYDIVEPAAALQALERELESLVAASGPGATGDERAICDALCLLIKQECDAEVSSSSVNRIVLKLA